MNFMQKLTLGRMGWSFAALRGVLKRDERAGTPHSGFLATPGSPSLTPPSPDMQDVQRLGRAVPAPPGR